MPLDRITGPIARRGALTFATLAKVGFGIASKPSTVPAATGTDAVAIGDSAAASGDYGVAIGQLSDAGSANSIAIGLNADVGVSTSVGAIAIGNLAAVLIGSTNTICIGARADTEVVNSEDGVCIGADAAIREKQQVAIGDTSSAFNTGTGADGNVAVGHAAGARGTTAGGVVAIGDNCFIESDHCIGIGDGAYIGAAQGPSIAIGWGANCNDDGGLAIGEGASAFYPNSKAIGTNASDNHPGDVTFSLNGGLDNSHHLIGMFRTTADATPVVLYVEGTEEGMNIFSGDAWAITGELVARQDGGNCAYWTFRALFKNVAGTPSLVDSSITEHADETAGVSAALGVNVTSDNFEITVTGIAATNIGWTASIRGARIDNP